MTTKKLWEILVPCIMRGKPVRTRHHKEWDKVVRKISGGLTLFAVAKGQWKHPETQEVIAERVIPVRFTGTDTDMKTVSEFTLLHYNQHTVMVYEISNNVYFFRYEK